MSDDLTVETQRNAVNQRLMALKTKYVYESDNNATCTQLCQQLNMNFEVNTNAMVFQGTYRHNIREIEVAYQTAIDEVRELIHTYHALGDIDEVHCTGNERVVGDIRRICTAIVYTKQALINYHLRNEQLVDVNYNLLIEDETAQTERVGILKMLGIQNRDMFQSVNKLTDFQKTLYTVLEACMQLKLRVSSDTLYEPKTVRAAQLLFSDDGEKICHICGKEESQHSTPSVPGSQRDDHVFVAKYEETINNRIFETMAFVKVSTVKEFVDKCSNNNGQEVELFSTKNAGILKQVSEFIEGHSSLTQCPRLKPNRHAFAFRNGLLIIYSGHHSLPRFFPYFCCCRNAEEECDGSECGWGNVPTVVATKYFSIWYDHEKIFRQLQGPPQTCTQCHCSYDTHNNDDHSFQGVPFSNMERNEDHTCMYCGEEAATCECDQFWPFHLTKDAYNSIRMPWVDSIFSKQDINGDVRKWVKILFGRLLFDINHLDGWQVMIFIKGVGGSGKSKLVYHMNKCFNSDQIGRLQGKSQEQFVLGDLYNYGKSLIVSCPECDENLSMARTDFLSLVAGDGCSITIKNGGLSLSIDKWTAPMIMAGNALPVRKDTSDAEARRVMMIDHPNQVQFIDKDTKLDKRMDQDHPAFLTACAGLYLSYAYVDGAKDIWGICPDYFRHQKNRVRQNSNVLASFLTSCELLVKHPDAYIPRKDFIETLKSFATENGFATRGIRFTDDDFYRVAFAQAKLKFVNNHKVYPPAAGRRMKKKYVVGVGLKEYFQHLDPDGEDVMEINNNASHMQTIFDTVRDETALNAIQALLRGDVLAEFKEMRV